MKLEEEEEEICNQPAEIVKYLSILVALALKCFESLQIPERRRRKQSKANSRSRLQLQSSLLPTETYQMRVVQPVSCANI